MSTAVWKSGKRILNLFSQRGNRFKIAIIGAGALG